MNSPTPNLLQHSPLEVVDARTLFASATAVRRHFAGLCSLPGGVLLLTFMFGAMPRRNDGGVMLSRSDDGGQSWSEPMALFAVPGWDCFPNGGICNIWDNHIRLYVGQYKFAPELGGEQPFSSEWFTRSTDSFDGALTWTEPTENIRIFPAWSEFYGASNPHRRSDGRLLWGVAGTRGRDEGWEFGVTVTDEHGASYSDPAIVASHPDYAYSDGDIVRLESGRLLCVLREHSAGDTFTSFSDDEGQTWSDLRDPGFVGASFKLNMLESGMVTCLYRDEEPARRGVSLSVSEDGGDSWTWAGQLYSAPDDANHAPGYFGGGPDMESLGNGEYAAVLHSYEDDDGEMCIHFLRLRER